MRTIIMLTAVVTLVAHASAGAPPRDASARAKAAATIVSGAEDVVLRLRPSADVRGDTALLGDVIWAPDAPAELRARVLSQPVSADLRSASDLTLTHAQVAQRLEELGVNLSRTLLVGAAECHLRIERTGGESAAAADSSTQESAAALMRSKPAGAERTLAEFLREQLNEPGAKLGTVQVEFERSGREYLELTTSAFKFRLLTPLADATKPGLRELRVSIEEPGKLPRTARLFARVSLVRSVVVARRALNVGAAVKREDIELQARIFTDTAELGLNEIERAVGQQVKSYVAPGELVRSADLKSVDLVQRSRPVSVVSNGGGVNVQATGTALDSGGYGDTIRVRLGDARKNSREVRAQIVGAGKVRLVEED